MTTPEYSFVVPLFNEELSVRILIDRLNNVITANSLNAEVVLVDDGSKDNTALLMHDIAMRDAKYSCIFLSRNHGHQLALTAGLTYARASKAVMVIDGDLQDPPELILDFIKEMNTGYDVVYGVRTKRREGFFKRMAYRVYYRIMNNIANIDLPLDSGDFALISRRVLDLMNTMPEKNRYLRGMRAWTGFRQKGFEYERDARNAGRSKYTFRKLMHLALSGLYNFSDLPIKIMTYVGVSAIFASFIYLITVLYKKYFSTNGEVPTGFTATIIIIIFFSGVQLMAFGIIGQYVLRIYREVQQRPLFIVDKIVRDKALQKLEGAN